YGIEFGQHFELQLAPERTNYFEPDSRSRSSLDRIASALELADRANDLAHGNAAPLLGQHVAAFRATMPCQDARPHQMLQDLFQIAPRDAWRPEISPDCTGWEPP